MLGGRARRRDKAERSGTSRKGGSRNVVHSLNDLPDGNFSRKRSAHLADTSCQHKLLNHEAALKKEIERLESHDSHWIHPTGFHMLNVLRVLILPFDPVLGKTGHWIQPEDPEDIPAMFDSYLNINCLYYSLVGVLAIETSLNMEIPNPEADLTAQWLLTISRFCWTANGVWSMSAVVAAFHTLFSIYVTPTWAKRDFVFKNAVDKAGNRLKVILFIRNGAM